MGNARAARERVADFWDDLLAGWTEGRREVPAELQPWFASLTGTGKGAVDLAHYPDPYVGDLRGVRREPRLVLLGLNPGVGYDELQGPDGTWTRRIAEQGYSRCFERSPAEDVEGWVALHGKSSRYWHNLERFARRWLRDDDAGVADILNLELYPWHSVGITGTLAPPAEAVQRFVWEPVQEVEVGEVFAFGKPWFAICEALGLPKLAHHGAGRPWPVEAPKTWELAIYQLPSGQVVVVSAQAGFAGPPGAERLEIMRGLVEDMQDRVNGLGSLHDPGIGLPWEVQEALASQQVGKDVYRLFALLAQRRSFTVNPTTSSQYVAIAPLHDRPVAAYVHQTYLDVAVTPEAALRLSAREGWHVVKTNPTTAYVRIEAATLKSAAGLELALEVLAGAIDKGEQGPKHSAATAKGPAVQQSAPATVCPVHGTEMLGGECDQCA